MIEKIVSGNRTAADIAALDVAMKFNLPNGDRTQQNLLDSQGLLLFYRHRLPPGPEMTPPAELHGKPFCAVNLGDWDVFEAAMLVSGFIEEYDISRITVAGSRIDEDPSIYVDVKIILEGVIYMAFLSENQTIEIPFQQPPVPEFPGTLAAAVALLESELNLKDKVAIARIPDIRIRDLYFSWQEYLIQRLGLDTGNAPLMASCRDHTPLHAFTPEDGVMAVIRSVKKKCEHTHRLRVVP